MKKKRSKKKIDLISLTKNDEEFTYQCPIANLVKNTCQENNKHNTAGYDENFCSMLIEHMCEGLSFESFAGKINKTKKVIEKWVEEYPEFLQAKEIGEGKGRLYWEMLFVHQANGGIGGNVQATTLKLKNIAPEDYKDQKELKHSGQVQWILDSGIRREGDKDFIEWQKKTDKIEDAEFKEVDSSLNPNDDLLPDRKEVVMPRRKFSHIL